MNHSGYELIEETFNYCFDYYTRNNLITNIKYDDHLKVNIVQNNLHLITNQADKVNYFKYLSLLVFIEIFFLR